MSVPHPVAGEPLRDATPLHPFDSVRLLEDLPASAVMFLDDEIMPAIIAAGAPGAVVDVYDAQRGFYEVELTNPVPALAPFRGDQIERR